MSTQRLSFAGKRWRMMVSTLVGVVVGALAGRFGLRPGASTLVGWNGAGLLYLATTGWLFAHEDEAGVRSRASAEDENRGVILMLVLCAVAVSFGAIVVALREAKGQHSSAAAALAALSVLTLIVSWLLVQVLFTLHYAHRYFGDRDGNGLDDQGVKFPGEPPSSYRDFFYMAVCMGATFHVSDFNIVKSLFRSLITLHALIAFLFNTMVLALGINIVATLLGQ